jgi:hypothetical protein
VIGESNVANNLSVGVHFLALRARDGTPGGQPTSGSGPTGGPDV